MKCPDCGVEMEVKSLRGTKWPYKSHKDVVLNADVMAPQCPKCGESMIKGSQCREIDTALELELEKK